MSSIIAVWLKIAWVRSILAIWQVFVYALVLDRLWTRRPNNFWLIEDLLRRYWLAVFISSLSRNGGPSNTRVSIEVTHRLGTFAHVKLNLSLVGFSPPDCARSQRPFKGFSAFLKKRDSNWSSIRILHGAPGHSQSTASVFCQYNGMKILERTTLILLLVVRPQNSERKHGVLKCVESLRELGTHRHTSSKNSCTRLFWWKRTLWYLCNIAGTVHTY